MITNKRFRRNNNYNRLAVIKHRPSSIKISETNKTDGEEGRKTARGKNTNASARQTEGDMATESATATRCPSPLHIFEIILRTAVPRQSSNRTFSGERAQRTAQRTEFLGSSALRDGKRSIHAQIVIGDTTSDRSAKYEREEKEERKNNTKYTRNKLKRNDTHIRRDETEEKSDRMRKIIIICVNFVLKRKERTKLNRIEMSSDRSVCVCVYLSLGLFNLECEPSEKG